MQRRVHARAAGRANPMVVGFIRDQSHEIGDHIRSEYWAHMLYFTRGSNVRSP